jgi:aminopeptidase N
MEWELGRKRKAFERMRSDRLSKQALGQDNVDVLDYDLELSIDPANREISGRVEIIASCLEDSVHQIVLDASDSLEVLSVEEEGENLAFSHSGDLLTIQLSRSHSLGDTLRLAVAYRRQFHFGNFEGLTFSERENGQVSIWTLSEPTYARTWWPCKDVPSDKATASLAVTVPDTMVVASNGILEGVEDAGPGWATYLWKENYPIATYLVSVAISNYRTFQSGYVSLLGDTVPVVYYVYPEVYDEAIAMFDTTLAMMKFLALTFGEYPFVEEKYGLAETPIWGMENQTCTSIGSMLLHYPASFERIDLHELAHQWWGDMLTPEDWANVWLNEGFASYTEALWAEHKDGRQAYLDYMALMDDPTGFEGSVYDPDQLFGPTVYHKGAWVLHMLRRVMGDCAFFLALRAYAAHPQLRYANVTTQDFQSICEAYYGGSLDWFFDQWVYGTGRPVYDVWWVQYQDQSDTFHVTLRVRQDQAKYEGLFEMPVDVRFVFASGDTTVQTVWNDQELQAFAFAFPESVTQVAWDPEGWVLKRIFYLPSGAEDRPMTVRPSLRLLRNPFEPPAEILVELTEPTVGELAVYDVRGRRVRILYRGRMSPERACWTWDGRDESGKIVPSGIYFLRFRGGGEEAMRKAVLIW